MVLASLGDKNQAKYTGKSLISQIIPVAAVICIPGFPGKFPLVWLPPAPDVAI
jgi:hypothetical protein